jgi:hypothetical protein
MRIQPLGPSNSRCGSTQPFQTNLVNIDQVYNLDKITDIQWRAKPGGSPGR